MLAWNLCVNKRIRRRYHLIYMLSRLYDHRYQIETQYAIELFGYVSVAAIFRFERKIKLVPVYLFDLTGRMFAAVAKIINKSVRDAFYERAHDRADFHLPKHTFYIYAQAALAEYIDW